MSISQHSHKFYQYEVLKDSPCTNNLWVSASSQLTSASKTSPLTLAAESKYTGRAPWEGGTSQLVCYSLHIWKRKWWLYASLHFSLLGQEEQTNLMQVWIAVELLVPVPPQQLGPAGVEAAFSLAPAPWQRSLDYPWHCVTPSSPAAGELGHGSAAPQHDWGWPDGSGKLVVSALLPTLHLICPSVQPAKKKVSFQPASNTRCPPSAVSSAAAWNRDMSWNTVIIQKITSRHSSQKWILWDIFRQPRSKLCKKVPAVMLLPEPWSRIWTDLQK